MIEITPLCTCFLYFPLLIVVFCAIKCIELNVMYRLLQGRDGAAELVAGVGDGVRHAAGGRGAPAQTTRREHGRRRPRQRPPRHHHGH